MCLDEAVASRPLRVREAERPGWSLLIYYTPEGRRARSKTRRPWQVTERLASAPFTRMSFVFYRPKGSREVLSVSVTSEQSLWAPGSKMTAGTNSAMKFSRLH